MVSLRVFKTSKTASILLDGAPARKYHNRRIPGPAPDGGIRMYDSIKEAHHAESLRLRKQAGDIQSWEPQARIALKISGVPLVPFQGKQGSVYVADFLVITNEGAREIHEVKGYVNPKDPITRLWQLKIGILQAMWPDVKIIVV